jgi:hypothetical protein
MHTMKKLLALLLAVLFVFAMTACAAPAASSASSALSSAAAASDDAAAVSPDDTAVASSAANTGMTPSGSFSRYADAKSAAYDKVSKKLEDQPELTMTVGLSLAGIAASDLSLLTISAMTGDAATTKIALGMVGAKDIDVQINGNTYTISFGNSKGEKVSQTAEYDPATDSISTVIKDGAGKETMTMEYVKIDGGYASQYYSPEGEGSLITCYFTDSIVCFGICKAAAAPASIFKNTHVGADIVKNDALYITLTGDTLIVTQEGKETTY